MANNTTLNATSGGDTIRDIDRSGVKTQVVQMDVGGASAESLLVLGQGAMAASLPVVLASNQTSIPVTLTSTTLTGTSAVSGTVTANAGTNLNTSALALDATITGGTQQTKITDGTNVATVKAASTAAVATDKAVVVAISPNNTVPVSLTSTTITGAVAATQSGTWTIQPGNTANTTAWKVDGSAVTQPVSGTFWQATQPVSFTMPALVAGSALVGKVGIDQTTPGTTNLVSIGTNGTVTIGAGSAVIGHVITDTGSTTAVTGNVAVTSAGLTNIDVALSTRLKPADTLAGVTTVAAVTAITNALPTGSNVIGALTANQSVNVSQINTVTPLMGNGVTGTGSQRVTIASDNTAFPIKVSDGTNTATVKAASTAAAAADTAVVVSISPNSVASTSQVKVATVNTATRQTVSTTSGTILASNTARKKLYIQNVGITTIYIAFAQTPTASVYHIALAKCSTAANDGTGGTLVEDQFTGAINAISSATGGAVVVTEF